MKKGLDLRIQVEDTVPEAVWGDPLWLQQILLNLAGNAVKFTAAGYVGVTVCTRDETAVFAVEDTGIGIEKDRLGKIFEEFVQGDDSITRKFGGSGLGLAISSRLADLMQGSLTVESEPGKGSRFELSIPLRPAPAPSLLVQPAPTPAAGRSPAESMRVLVAEDNRVNQLIVRRFLENAGHKVQMVENGQQALDALELKTFDALLLDIEMPVMGGAETIAHIRRHEKANKLPRLTVVDVTAHALTGDRARFLAMGMDDCIAKPIHQASLYECMERLRESASHAVRR